MGQLRVFLLLLDGMLVHRKVTPPPGISGVLPNSRTQRDDPGPRVQLANHWATHWRFSTAGCNSLLTDLLLCRAATAGFELMTNLVLCGLSLYF